MPDGYPLQHYQALHVCLLHAGMIARSGMICANATDWKLVDVADGYPVQHCQALHVCSLHAGMIARSGMIGANVTEWKLVDVPELGYYTTNKPFPRGELHIKTKAMIPGYYKQQRVSPCFL